MPFGMWDECSGELTITRKGGQQQGHVRNSAITVGGHRMFGVETVGNEIHVLSGSGGELPAADPQRVRRGATLLRLNLPQVPPLPHATPALSLPVTHRFPGRGSLFLCAAPPRRGT